MKKKLFILLALLIFIFVQCREDTSQQPASITGTWKWVYTYKDIPLSSTNPATPANTGIQETIIFYSNNTWKQIQNNVTTDSGDYNTGYGHYMPNMDGNGYSFNYDSISFYKSNIRVGWDSYEILHNDTLAFIPYLSGRLSSYLLPYNGSKWYVKQ